MVTHSSNITADTRILGMTIKEAIAAVAMLFIVFTQYNQISQNEEDVSSLKKELEKVEADIRSRHDKDNNTIATKFEALINGQNSNSGDMMVLRNDIAHLSSAISKLGGVIDRAFPYKPNSSQFKIGEER